MIKTEIKGNLAHTWSDFGMKIHGGFPEADYDEAYDPIDAGRTYVETDIPIGDEEATSSDYEEALEEMGVSFEED